MEDHHPNNQTSPLVSNPCTYSLTIFLVQLYALKSARIASCLVSLLIWLLFQVALKLIPKVGKSSKEIACLRHECKLQRELDHPNIVRMLVSLTVLANLLSLP
jgi:hypothetical protein